MKVLQDILVLDLTHMLSAPYATMAPPDLGARTIKIESLAGEATRKMSGVCDGTPCLNCRLPGTA